MKHIILLFISIITCNADLHLKEAEKLVEILKIKEFVEHEIKKSIETVKEEYQILPKKAQQEVQKMVDDNFKNYFQVNEFLRKAALFYKMKFSLKELQQLNKLIKENPVLSSQEEMQTYRDLINQEIYNIAETLHNKITRIIQNQ